MEIINGVLVVGLIGLILGGFLSFAAKKFHVQVNHKIEEVRQALPGANCGACGFPGCDGLATDIALNDGDINACPVGGQVVADKLAEIMGKVAGENRKEVAVVLCQGSKSLAKDRFIYNGPNDCRINNSLAGGSKACTYGCLGCGTCKEVCQFDAIEIIDGLAIINKEKCTACLRCVEICPKEVITMVPYEQEYIVKCNSNDSGRIVRQNCDIGCIGCNICVRTSPEAYEMEDLLAKAKFGGANPEEGAAKCPTGAIYGLPEIEEKKVVNN